MKDFAVNCISQVLLHKNQSSNLSGVQQEALLSQYTVFKVKVQDIPTAQAVCQVGGGSEPWALQQRRWYKKSSPMFVETNQPLWVV